MLSEEQFRRRIAERAFFLAQNGASGGQEQHWRLAEALEHKEWLVLSRSENQRSTFNLYTLLVNYERQMKNKVSLDIVQQLTSASFSLWRAVFLGDTHLTGASRHKDLEKFLSNLIDNNTVGYVQDKAASHWTFGYYVQNARDRLARIARFEHPQLVPDDHIVKIYPKEYIRSSRQAWDDLHEACVVATENLG